MNKSLPFQVGIILVSSIILAGLNNLRVKNPIPLVRQWPTYSELAAEKMTPQNEAHEETTTTEEAVADASAEGQAATVPEMVVSNQGITEIDLEKAHQIYTYARDLTLWIDARDPDLYEEGHIAGAHLLHLYDKNAYLPDVLAAIEERQPVALVVYCKGKDCTDSHHLAQDLQDMGYGNIFDYRGGFDDWYAAGYEIGGALAAAQPAAAGDAGADDEVVRGETEALVAANQGITDIGLEEAYRIHQYAADLTLWIDAREPALYETGHIEGAQLLYLYDENTYLPIVEAAIQERSPIALVIYCKGKECTDSHHLAQDLQGRGYGNIFVYRDGFDDWYAAGYPIAGQLATADDSADLTVTTTTRAPLAEKPPGMYLEHILRDLLPFLFGFLLLVFWKKSARSRSWVLAASLVVGLFFIWAALPKIENPFAFAKNIWNYDIAPSVTINLSALILPMVELICGIGLITGAYRRGSGFLVSGLLVIFIVAVSYNVLRGHEFNCGCTSQETVFSEVYLEGWSDKITLLLRDLGLLVMSAMALLYKGSKQVRPEAVEA